jgi:hypothetical protein
MAELAYEVVRNIPVARFYYKGTHSHPVRRTVLIIESKPTYLRGYELREGSTVRNLSEAPVKSYKKAKIAKESDLGANKHRKPGPAVSTLQRMNLLDLLKSGF